MLKRAVALIVCLVIILLSVFSCSGEASVNTAVITEATTAYATEITETEPEYVKPDIDFSGRDFGFSTLQENNPNWTVRKYVEAYAAEQNGDAINDSIYLRKLSVEEALDVNIVPTLYSDISQMTKTTLAGDYYADCVIMNGVGLKTVQNSSLAYDLNSINTLDLTKSWWNQECVSNFSLGGRLFGAAGDISVMGLLSGHCVYVNKALINNYSLDNPYDMVRDGTWTLDEMGRLGRAVASDINGDGVMDGNDRFGLSSEAIGMARMLASGIYVTEKDENDVPQLSIDTERAARAVEKMVALWRDKNITLYSGDFSSQYKSVFRDFIFKLFVSDQVLFINNWLVWTLDLRIMESDFGVLPPPKLDSEQERYMVGMSEGFTTYAVIPLTIPDVDFTGHVVEALGYYGKVHMYPALIETTITNKTIRDNDSGEMIELIYNSRFYEPASIYDWGGVNSLFSSFISDNKTEFASKYASYESKIISGIESTMQPLNKQ